MEEKEEQNKNKGLNCLGQIIIGLIIIAVIYGVGDFLKANKEFSIILSILFLIWMFWRFSKS